MNLIFFRPGYKKRIPGQGMPLISNPDKYGDMIIEFNVEYPTGLDTEQKFHIKEALINNQTNKKQHHHQSHHRKKVVTHEE
jgi:DnaJ family protein B protein 13